MEKEKLTTKKKCAIFFAPHILRLSGLFFCVFLIENS